LAVIILAGATFVIGNIVYSARIRLALDRVEAERNRAELNLQVTMRAIDEMLSKVGEQTLKSEPHMEETRQALLEKALKLYQDLLDQQRDDPRVRFETAQAHRRMANVLRLLGQSQLALESYNQAIDLLTRLQRESPGNARSDLEVALCKNMHGETLRGQSQVTAADNDYRQAQEILEALQANHSNDVVAGQELARTLYNRGIVLRQQEPAEAEKQFQRAVTLL